MAPDPGDLFCAASLFCLIGYLIAGNTMYYNQKLLADVFLSLMEI
jgi:hypothetical protein